MPNLTADQDDDRIKNEAADWCMRNHSGPLTRAEAAAFAEWLNADPAHTREYAAMEKTWAASAHLTPSATSRAAEALPPTWWASRHVKKGAALVAATALLAVVGWFAGWVPQSVDLHTSTMEPRQSGLPDGSTVELNIGTTLIYAEFRDSRRAWLLDGEAVFEVAPDVEHPFNVITDSASVTVTGTRFNVWSNPQQLVVTLESGNLLIQDDDLPESIALSSGEQLVFYPGHGSASVTRVDPSTAFAWRDGKLVFDDVALRHALPMINRYLSTPLRLGDARLADRRISGIYSISQLDQLPSALSAMLGLHLVQQGSELVLYPG